MTDGHIAIIGVARVGAARVGYCPTGLLCQVGRRTLPARVGVARVGAARVGATVLSTALRYLEQSSFQMRDSGYTDPPTCDFEIVCLDTDIRPRVGDMVVIAVGTLRRRFFGGNLVSCTESRQFAASGRSVYRCQAVGYLRRLQRIKNIFASYSSALAGDILKALFAEHAPTYDATMIQDGPTLNNLVFDGCSLLEACNTLAAQANYLFYINPLRQVIFRPQDTELAPWVLTDESASEIEISDTDDEFLSRVIVRYSIPERRTQHFLGNGETKEFPLYGTIDAVHSLTVDDVAVSYGWRYTEDNSENDFSIRGTNPAYIATIAHPVLTVGQRLTITYTALFPARIAVSDRAAITARQSVEGGTGLYDEVLTNRDLRVTDAVALATETLDRADAARYAVSYTRLELLSQVFTRLLRVGQLQTVQVHDYDTQLMIQEITMSVLRPASDLSALLQLDVQLGRKIYTLTDIFKSLTPPSDVPANERTSVMTV